MKEKIIAVMLGATLLSGCSTYSLQELRQAVPQGNKFQTALAKLYMDFSEQEEKDYDWQDSWYFADKGLRAIYGKDTAPEELENWNLPAETLEDLTRMRAKLTAALTQEATEKHSGEAADAQFYFDCLLEQQEEAWQNGDIEYCREKLERSLAKLGVSTEKYPIKESVKKARKLPKKQPAKSEKKTEKKTEAMKKSAPVLTKSFMLLFEKDSDALKAGADSVAKDITKTVAGYEEGSYEVLLADKTTGAKSAERTAQVKKILSAAGVKESDIREGGGEKKNIKYRVEIFIND